MKKHFSYEYLDFLLLNEGFSAQETEVLFSLSKNHGGRENTMLISLDEPSQSMKFVYNSGIYDNVQEIKEGVTGLLNKGILREVHAENGTVFTLSDWTDIEDYFSPSKKKDAIARKLKELFFHSESEMYGLIFNPAATKVITKNMNGRDIFYRYHHRFKETLPQADIKAMCKCNLNCIYCCNPHVTEYLPFKAAEKEIHKAKTLGFKNIIISGGEFTIRKDNVKIIKAAADAGFQNIEFFTNGLMFYYDDTLETLIKSGVTSIFLHVSAIEKKLYEATVRRKDTYSILRQTLEKLSQFPDIALTITTVVNTLNLKHIMDMSTFFYEYNQKANFKTFFHVLVFHCVFSSLSNAWGNRLKLIPRMSEAAPYIQEALNAANKRSSQLLYARIPFCLMKGYEIHNFDLYNTFANFYADRGALKTNNTYIDTLFTKTDACGDCIHNSYCVGIMRPYAKMYGLEEFSPVTG